MHTHSHGRAPARACARTYRVRNCDAGKYQVAVKAVSPQLQTSRLEDVNTGCLLQGECFVEFGVFLFFFFSYTEAATSLPELLPIQGCAGGYVKMCPIKSKKRFEYCSGFTVEISAPAPCLTVFAAWAAFFFCIVMSKNVNNCHEVHLLSRCVFMAFNCININVWIKLAGGQGR